LDEPPQGETRLTRAGAKRSWLASRVTLALLAFGLLGTSIPLALARHAEEPSPGVPSPVPSPTVAPPRVPFAFPPAKLQTEVIRAGGRAAARKVAGDIQASLSGFYDQVFLDPLTWAAGAPPDIAWDVFDEPLRGRAAEDLDALTLGSAAAGLAALDVTRSTLQVEVLLDPKGRPQAAVAVVVFRADGSLTSGEEVRVVNRASFLFEPESGEWLIVGYPSTSTIVKSIGADP
jgi:hypothetical protein